MKRNRKRFSQGLNSVLAILAIFFLCLCFSLAGFFGSIMISQDGTRVGQRHRVVESTELEENESIPNGETGDSSLYQIPFQVLSWRPRALYFPNFASAEQCQSIIEISRSNLRPSGLVLRAGETTHNTKGLRTSSGTFIRAAGDRTGILDSIEKKIARVTMIPQSNGEPFNILRYEVGQRYVPPMMHSTLLNMVHKEAKGYLLPVFILVASFLLYLTNVEEGGETMFPNEVAWDEDKNGSNMGTEYNPNSCLGLKVKPHQGDALLFYSLFPNGTIDKTALHGSCPVIRGEKWVATKWIRDQVL